MEFSYGTLALPSVPETAPTRHSTKLCVGRLVKAGVYFPWGCAGLVGVRIFHYEAQLYPTNRNEWFIGNEILIEFECDYLILEGWNNFKVEVYNSDDFYPHTPIVTFNILPLSSVVPHGQPWIEG